MVMEQLLEGKVVSSANAAARYSLLVDDMTDITSKEQMIAFIQAFSKDTNEVFTDFLFIEDVHEKGDSISANAATLFKVICEKLDELELPTANLAALVTDGASVMTGQISGLATRLKEVIPHLITFHCVCHKLALSCGDTDDCSEYISVVTKYLTELWKLFTYSNKRTAIFVKTQLFIQQLDLQKNQKTKVAKKLKKACKTRWLSTEDSVRSALENYPAIIQSLLAVKNESPTAAGLLGFMNTAKFLSCLHVLGCVLPILAAVSRTFQKSHVMLSEIQSVVKKAKDDLEALVENDESVAKLCEHVEDLAILDFSVKEQDIEFCSNLLKIYTDNLQVNLDNRFVDAPIVHSMYMIFDVTAVPKVRQDFSQYGAGHIQAIADHFYPDDDDTKQRLAAEWSCFKYTMREWQQDLPPSAKQNPIN
ncbi:zinc finger protein 862-like [Gigantopelta aegis]|uniref:zinc finger protein 862-like n=1 Tax=Gigantopelta aegis TaxID=1735272 RepID=UPI001B88BAB8|nr:zinc finger protein 862-like [Gigantopelta aegis]